jgi:hypothetical protein
MSPFQNAGKVLEQAPLFIVNCKKMLHACVVRIKQCYAGKSAKEFSCENKMFFLFGLPAVLLALGLVLAGCDASSGDGGDWKAEWTYNAIMGLPIGMSYGCYLRKELEGRGAVPAQRDGTGPPESPVFCGLSAKNAPKFF